MTDSNQQNKDSSQQDNDSNQRSSINEAFVDNSSASTVDPTEAVTESNIPDKTDAQLTPKVSKAPILLSLLAILTAIGGAGGSFYYLNQQNAQQIASLTTDFQAREAILQKEIANFKGLLENNTKAAQTEQKKVTEIREKLEKTLKAFETKQSETFQILALEKQTIQSQVTALQDKVNRLAAQDNTTWLISQADFYVKMAARRLWTERDILTAISLLKTADSTLAEMNDSSLIETRSAITTDIATLAAIKSPDIDGIIARLASLTNIVDGLILKPEYRWVAPESLNKAVPTESISDWRQNLLTNWRQFSSDFISIRRVDAGVEPILAPEQVIYLRENIRARLFLASQAVSRQQDAVYQQTLNDVLTVINQYFDVNEQQTVHIINELTDLKLKSLSITLPEKFKSTELIARLVDDRVSKWINQPAAPKPTQEQPAEVQPSMLQQNTNMPNTAE